MSDTKHTPTPWTVRAPVIPVGRDKEGNGLVFSEETKEHVAEVFQYRNDDHKDATTSLANAEFIVRACNAHDELLAACERLLPYVELLEKHLDEETDPGAPKIRADCDAARDAIAKTQEAAQ